MSIHGRSHRSPHHFSQNPKPCTSFASRSSSHFMGNTGHNSHSSRPSIKCLRVHTSSSPSRTSQTASILQTRSLHPASTSQLGMAFFNFNNEGKENFSNDDDEDFSDEDNDEDMSLTTNISLEEAREQFESMMSMPNDNVDRQKEKEKHLEDGLELLDSLDPNLSKHILATKSIRNAVLSKQDSPPPLTAIMRERRLKEIQLISTLAHSDKAINELWALWIAERGATAAATLLRAEELMSVESWHEAEQSLLGLIDEHGIHWAEPVNRLATLYYMQSRYEESKVLCEIVLNSKPWHFGALSGIVLVCTAMNDASGAREWANKRLPPLLNENYDSNGRRNAWANKAVDDAKESLRKASLVGRSRDIGEKEVEFRNFRARMEEQIQEDKGNDSLDAWQ